MAGRSERHGGLLIILLDAFSTPQHLTQIVTTNGAIAVARLPQELMRVRVVLAHADPAAIHLPQPRATLR